MTKLDLLYKKHPYFIYQSYSYELENNNLSISFRFLIAPDLKFETKIDIRNILKKRFQKINEDILDNLIFHLGLIEMLNYWKLTCSPKIIIEAGNLSTEEKRFLRKIIKKGMGQYFYENNIDFTKKGFLKIETNKQKPIHKAKKIKFDHKKILIPIGGGKDSIVVLEKEKKERKELGLFLFNPKAPQKKVAKISKIKEIIIAKRKLDNRIFKLNSKGYLNGHVPFSAFLSFLTILVAYLFEYSEVAFAWEKSANEPNLKYRNRWINHQWSKSSEFETNFSQYSKEFLIKNIKIYSPIRGWSEIEIAKSFSMYPQYHQAFISCNNAYKASSKIPRWCGKCPKCLFVFTSLYPFLGKKKLIKIFGKNLFEDKTLLPLMLALIGKKSFKPFECVGTIKESYEIFRMALKKAQEEGEIPYLLKQFQKINH